MPTLGPSEGQARFSRALRRFIGAFSARRPLVLFLDDLQWADSGTLELVEQIGAYPETRHVLFIGAYRDNEVSPTHGLRRVLGELRQSGRPLDGIALEPLRSEDIAGLVADAFRRHTADPAPLSALVYEKTGGNPFFAVQFLTAMHEEGLVSFDYEATAWRWDMTYRGQGLFEQRRGSHGHPHRTALPGGAPNDHAGGVRGNARRRRALGRAVGSPG